MTLNRKSQGQGHRERLQLRRSHQGLFSCKVWSLNWSMWPRTNINAEVNQMLTDWQTDGRTDGHHQSISRNCFAIRPKTATKIWLQNGTKNNNTSSYMLLDHCYAFGIHTHTHTQKRGKTYAYTFLAWIPPLTPKILQWFLKRPPKWYHFSKRHLIVMGSKMVKVKPTERFCRENTCKMKALFVTVKVKFLDRRKGWSL